MTPHINRRPDAERINIDELKRRFTYHADTGEVRRNRILNRRGVNKKTGGVSSTGYHRIKIDDVQYLTHHLAFAMVHGRYPIEVNHKDGDKLNNRIDNLEELSHKENSQHWRDSHRVADGIYRLNGGGFNVHVRRGTSSQANTVRVKTLAEAKRLRSLAA